MTTPAAAATLLATKGEGPTLTDSIARPSLADTAEDRVRALIIERVLLPRDLIDVSELADALGVSRTPMLTALDRLHIDGLVDRRGRHNARFVVSASDPTRARASLQALSRLFTSLTSGDDRSVAREALGALGSAPDGARTSQLRHELAAVCDRADNLVLAEVVRRSLDGLIHLAVYPHARAAFDAERIA